jgi:DNA-binding transcriptional LysR family regulator
VETRELARDRLVAVVPPDHPLASASSVTLQRLASEVFVDLPPRTAGRLQSDQAFDAAGLVRDVAFEVSTAELMARLVSERLAVALFASTYAPQLTGVATVEITDAPGRIEYVVWSSAGRSPAATAFLALLDIE